MVNGLDSQSSVEAVVGNAAGRIRRFFEAMEQAHSFGIEPGTFDQPWTLAFQRSATSVYAETCPWEYLLGLCDAYDDCANFMDGVKPPSGLVTEWVRMQEYLRSSATAMREGAPDGVGDLLLETATDIEPVAPPVVRFGMLAALVSAAGAEEWAGCMRKIEEWSGSNDTCPITEQERMWLLRVSRGDRTLDIATDDGYSERSLYRALSELWNRLGVDNRIEAIALATKNSWI